MLVEEENVSIYKIKDLCTHDAVKSCIRNMDIGFWEWNVTLGTKITHFEWVVLHLVIEVGIQRRMVMQGITNG
jgi:hypothetical protein